MKTAYFKYRQRFDFSPHTLDIGRPLFWSKLHEDNHLLYRLIKLDENKFEDFYRYHLNYYFSKNLQGQEKDFFRHIQEIVSDRIEQLRVKDPFKSSHPSDVKSKEQLKKFREFLTHIDQWHTHQSTESIIASQKEEIYNLTEQLSKLKAELKEARSLETTDRIRIAKDHLTTVIDLFIQLQELKLPDGKELMFSQTQSIWVKMICKYFEQDKDSISPETVRRYFPADKRSPGSKYSPVPPQSKLFKITAANKRS
ncbi:MAG: hypothetical protein WKF68_11000 [Daejeonella sp.]